MKTLLKTSMPLALLLVFFRLSVVPVLAQSTISAFAGAPDPYNGASAATVSFVAPQAVIPDGAGGFYLSTGSPQNSVYRVAFVNSIVTLIAGNGTAGYSGDGGPATSAQLNNPGGVALDSSGNLYIADTGNSRIRKVTPQGVISTVAGTGETGFSGDGGQATSARLNFPSAIEVDGAGNLFIGDRNNYRIRKVTTDGVISTIAGTGTSGFSGDGGPAVSANIGYLGGTTIDGNGNLWFSEQSNPRIRKINSNGIISTVAGTGSYGSGGGDGVPATSAQLAGPLGLALDAGGNLLIAEAGGRIRKVTPGGIISTVVSSINPRDVAVEPNGNLLVATGDNKIFRVSPTGTIISQAAGNGTFGFSGDNGPAISALLNSPAGMAFDAAANLFIADSTNNRIRKVTTDGVISTFAGNGVFGNQGDGGPATSAQLGSPGAVAVGPDGSVYITECSFRGSPPSLSNARIRRVSPQGVMSTFATSANWVFCYYDYYNYYYDPLASSGLVLDSHGNVFVASFNYRVYKVTPAGVVSVAVGTTYGFGGDGGPAISAQISQPRGLAIDASDNLYIADVDNNRIRKVTPDGIITTVAGSGTAGFDGDGGPATSAKLNYPTGVAVDSAGNLFIADANNYRVRKMELDGIISTVVGNGTAGSGGDDGPATSARLGSPTSVAVNSAGNLFISDSSNHRIRKVVFSLTIPTLTGLSPNFAAQGATPNVTLEGTSFTRPLTIDAGTGITVSNVKVLSEVQATATFTIASSVALGARNVNVSTNLGTSGNVSFNVIPPFPDLSIASSHSGNIGIGFNESFLINIANVGTAGTTSAMTVTDTLPSGLTYVSGSGTGWSCSAAGQAVNCTNPNSLAAGDSTNLNLVVAVGGNAPPSLIHAPHVDVAGDPVSSNNTASDPTVVAPPPPIILSFTPLSPPPGSQPRLNVTINQPFPHDVTGTVTLTFTQNAVNPADDPSVQFASGGRQATFTIRANTLIAQFPNSSGFFTGSIPFQMGTVAGTLLFNVTLQVGTVQTTASTSRTIQRQPPTIVNVQKEGINGASFTTAINLSSTPREVTQLILGFNTTPPARVSCGGTAGCTASGTTLTLDVKSLFDTWFTANTGFGGASILRVPLSIDRTATGSAVISLRNAMGTSSPVTIPLQ